MKKLLVILYILYASVAFAQNRKVNSFIVDAERQSVSYIEMPFIVDELLEIYKTDTTIISEHYVNISAKDRHTHMGAIYLYDMGVNALVDSLNKRRNSSNSQEISKIISELYFSKPIVPNVDWRELFTTCESCPFGEYPPDSYSLFKAAIIYSSENEIKQMILADNGKQWRYAIEDIENGSEYFEGGTSARQEIDRRIIKFLIDKWSPCQIPEVQDLVRVLKKVLPQEYKKAWYDAISGTWKGKFGDRVIELTIKANEWTIKGFSKFEGQPDSKRVEFYGENSYSQITGPFVTFTMNELPADKEWNGEFFCRLVRNTDKLEGTWRSNNKKLEREFVLEKVK